MDYTQPDCSVFKSLTNMRTCLSAFLFILFAFLFLMETGCKNVPPAVNRPHEKLSGTFVQLWDKHQNWTESQWRELFKHLNRLGIRELVIQWTVYDGDSFFQATPTFSKKETALNKILRMAAQSNMQVWLGLTYEKDFWKNIQNDTQSVEAYLKGLRLVALDTAKQLTGLVRLMGVNKILKGWYISEEIDDLNWMQPSKKRILHSHLKKLTEGLHDLTPNKKVAVSGFSNLHATPTDLAAFWSDLLAVTFIDVLFFQDGLGVRPLSWNQLTLYLEAVKNATKRSNCELKIVVELFKQVDGPPMNDLPFRAIPAKWDHIQTQLRVASFFSDTGVIAFSVPEYMTPLGGLKAMELYNSYLDYFKCSD